MTGQRLKEFVRRLSAEGYRFSPDENGAGAVYRNGYEAAMITETGEIHYKPENHELAYHIHGIRNNMDEYMNAYQNAKAADAATNAGYLLPLDWGNHVLGIKQLENNSYQFVTWEKDASGNGYNYGHYFEDFNKAKEDFAVRCGLIDKRKLFTETELLIMRSGLMECADLTPDRGITEVQAIRSLVEKINDLVIPQIAEQEDSAAEMGEEPEIDL